MKYTNLLNIVITFFIVSAIFVNFAHATSWQDRYAKNNEENLREGQSGWQVLSDDYRRWHIMDGLSLEWDYYGIHDDNGRFVGIIGYLLADPKGKLDGIPNTAIPPLMPSGANLAINGRLKDNDGNYSIGVNYLNFGLKFQASKTERYWYAEDGNGNWGKLEPSSTGSMFLSGETKDFSWNLEVRQAWGDGDYPNYHSLLEKTWEVANDIDHKFLNNQHWTVNPLWNTTYVTGTITDKQKGETYSIDGHGYRENSFGRWAFVSGGWDFWFHSDMENKVAMGFQTYHYYTEDLDFMDVSFIDNGAPVTVRFYAKYDELGWKHNEWHWDVESRQAVPKDMNIIAKNEDYTVKVSASIIRNDKGSDVLDFTPMLSSVTPVTKLYVIQCLYPKYSGTIYRNNDDGTTNYSDIVTKFGGDGGGEFATARSIFKNFNPSTFKAWLGKTYSHPFPE